MTPARNPPGLVPQSLHSRWIRLVQVSGLLLVMIMALVVYQASLSSGSLICSGDAAALGRGTAGKEMASQTWTQQRTERVRVKLWGAGGMGGPPVRLVPENGCKQRRLGKGGYRGSGTRADLNNHANQMNPNNWRYWSSRGVSPPWRSASSGSYASYGVSSAYVPRMPRVPRVETPGIPGSTRETVGSPDLGARPSFRFRRGLPLSTARRWARKAKKAARKWLPRERRWKVSQSDPSSVGACGELWLCGGGGGGGAFTDAVVNLTAGKRYSLQVGLGGFPSSPRGTATRLLELDASGALLLAEAAGGFGAAVDEERLVALGGAGAPASDAAGQWTQPGMDGEASRSSFEDLPYARLPLAGANLKAAKEMPLDELNLSLSAVRIPCAAAVKDGASEFEAGLTGETILTKYDNETVFGSRRAPSPWAGGNGLAWHEFKHTKDEPVTDHMLVCLPQDAGANGYDSERLHTRNLYLLDEKCAQDDFSHFYRMGKIVQVDGKNYYVAMISEFSGKRIIVKLVDSYYLEEPNDLYKQEGVSYEKDSACLFSRYGVEVGSQCLGSACVRDSPQSPCRGLPSCLDGLAAWSNVWSLGNPKRIQTFTDSPIYPVRQWNFKTFTLPTSSSGPRGGLSTATPNGQPAGHGGDGTCPDLISSGVGLSPMNAAVPKHAAPRRGEDGRAVFYKCSP